MEANIQAQAQMQQLQALQMKIQQAQASRAQQTSATRTQTDANDAKTTKESAEDPNSFQKLLNKMLGKDTTVEEAGELLRAFEEEMEGGDIDAAMQLLAQLFMTQTGFVQQVNPEVLAQLTGQSAETVTQVVQSMPHIATAALLNQQSAPVDATVQQPLQDGQAFLNELVKQTGMEVVQNSAGAQAGGGEGQNAALFGEAGYQRAVHQVQQQLDGSADKAQQMDTADKAVNVLLEESGTAGAKETKQTQQTPAAVPFSAQFANATGAAQAAEQAKPETDVQALLAQVKTGLMEGVQKGDNNFVIKLKPEGLGEITVRMIQQGDKITMDILANNQSTQRLLAGEISSLRQAMEPYNVVVNSQQADGGSTAFSLEQQMRQGFAQQEHHGRQESSYYFQQDDTPEEASANAWETQMASGLDVYT